MTLYSVLLQNLAKSKKSKKTDKNTQKEDKMTQNSSKETKANTTSKVDHGIKPLPMSFKIPNTLLDLAIVEKGLKTLLE